MSEREEQMLAEEEERFAEIAKSEKALAEAEEEYNRRLQEQAEEEWYYRQMEQKQAEEEWLWQQYEEGKI